jgi:hypothetical protein
MTNVITAAANTHRIGFTLSPHSSFITKLGSKLKSKHQKNENRTIKTIMPNIRSDLAWDIILSFDKMI